MNDLPDLILAELQERLGEEVTTINPLYGDVSTRRFYRLTWSGGSAVLMLYPEEPEPDLVRDYTMMTSFALSGLSPAILAQGKPWFLVRDAGDQDLATRLKESAPVERSAIIRRALGLIPRIQALPGGIQDLNPPLGQERFVRELDFTLRWYVEALLGRDPEIYRPFMAQIAKEAGSFRRAFSHRDYHANNILVSGQALNLVDVQDACPAPRFYDLVSLVNERDVAVLLPVKERQRLIREVAEGILCVPWNKAVEREVNVTSLQRTLKALGTFARQVVNGREAYHPYLETSQVVLKELLTSLPLPPPDGLLC